MNTSATHYSLTLDDGTVITCDSAVAVLELHALMRKRAEADEIPRLEKARRTRKPATTPTAAGSESSATRWTTPIVRKVLETATPAGIKLLRAVIIMPEPVTVTALMAKLKTSSGGAAQTINTLGRAATLVAPSLPIAVRTAGRIREKHVIFDPDFFVAMKEVLPTL